MAAHAGASMSLGSRIRFVAGHRAKRVRRGLGFRIEYGLEGRPQPQDGCASEREGAGALKRVIPRT
jgi:hypothetical protein